MLPQAQLVMINSINSATKQKAKGEESTKLCKLKIQQKLLRQLLLSGTMQMKLQDLRRRPHLK
eukprot:scaffold42383_cov62-Attheya_sp.AAC.10